VTLTPALVAILLLIGVLVGVISGMVGLGGGIMVIPALVLLFGFSQQKANGTSLAMLLPPIGIFAVMQYHKAGYIDWKAAMLLAAGFAVGAYVGGVMVRTGKVPEVPLRIMFSIMLLYVAGRMLFRTDGRAVAALKTVTLMIGFIGTYGLLRLLGNRWQRMPYWPSIYQDRRKLPMSQDYEI
jgi:uncharacterized protein